MVSIFIYWLAKQTLAIYFTLITNMTCTNANIDWNKTHQERTYKSGIFFLYIKYINNFLIRHNTCSRVYLIINTLKNIEQRLQVHCDSKTSILLIYKLEATQQYHQMNVLYFDYFLIPWHLKWIDQLNTQNKLHLAVISDWK